MTDINRVTGLTKLERILVTQPLIVGKKAVIIKALTTPASREDPRYKVYMINLWHLFLSRMIHTHLARAIVKILKYETDILSFGGLLPCPNFSHAIPYEMHL